MKICVTNHHTPYVSLLSNVFEALDVLFGWDYDQRSLPSNIRLINLNLVFFKTLKEYGVLISNRAVSDLLYIFLFLLHRKRIVIVLHGDLNRGGGSIRIFCKRLFYHSLFSILGKNCKVVCIQDKVRESYNLSHGLVIEPLWKLEMTTLNIGIDRFVVVANDISREQFNKSMLQALSLIKPVHILGRNNHEFRLEGNFVIIESQSEDDYKSELSKGGIAINCLTYPEACYNLGLLECISYGMPVVSLMRSDSIFTSENSSIWIQSNPRLFAELQDVEVLRAKHDRLVQLLNSKFSMHLFAQKWKQACNE